MAARRAHFGLTQAEVAARIRITQVAYGQIERTKQPRKANLQKEATAMAWKSRSCGGDFICEMSQDCLPIALPDRNTVDSLAAH